MNPTAPTPVYAAMPILVAPITFILEDVERGAVQLDVDLDTRRRIVDEFAAEELAVLTGSHWANGVERLFAIPVVAVAYIL